MGIIGIVLICCGVAIALFGNLKNLQARRTRLGVACGLIGTGLILLLLVRVLMIGY